MLGWFKKKPTRLLPESKWVITVDDDAIHVVDHSGTATSVFKRDLTGVAIETNDSGPWGADVWWLLFGAGDRVACAYPQGATGEQAALDYLMSLTSFDFSEVTNAMTSTGNATFPVWRRS